MDSLKVGDQFVSIDAARDAIRRFTLDDGESFRVIASDKKRYIISCKAASTGCGFRIRATSSSKGVTSVTILKPHTCSPATHYKNRHLNSLWYLKEHHRASVIENRFIAPNQLRANERLQYDNHISYLQAHRVKQALLEEIEGKEADCFAQFPAYIARLKAADTMNFAELSINTNGVFEAAFFAPGSLRAGFRSVRRFIALDGMLYARPYILLIY
jgi:MuDR family transposase